MSLLEAIDFAAQKHRLQRRKDSEETPYINHPVGVALLLHQAGVQDDTVLLAAILHDTVEDTDTAFEEIAQRFGTKVASMVREVTDDRTLGKEDRKQRQVDTIAGKSQGAKLIKLADKLYNLRDLRRELPKGWTEERRTDYFLWALEVTSRIKGTNEQLEGLCEKEISDFLAE